MLNCRFEASVIDDDFKDMLNYNLRQKSWVTFTFIWFYRLILLKIILPPSSPIINVVLAHRDSFGHKTTLFWGECSTLCEGKSIVYVSNDREKAICRKVSQGLLTEIEIYS